MRLRRTVALADERVALVLDLAAGGSLGALVAMRGPLTAQEVVTLIIPIVSALEHLHHSGLTHGDVSPGNLLFDADGCPRLGDLGVARVLGERHDDVWGTPGFTDPLLLEAVTCPPVPADVLRAADLWSLAACCWFALTGKPPGTGIGLLPEDTPGPGQQPGELRRLLLRCLSRDLDDRPSPSEFADLAWRAARPLPIRLGRADTAARAGEDSPALDLLTTRRVPARQNTGAAATFEFTGTVETFGLKGTEVPVGPTDMPFGRHDADPAAQETLGGGTTRAKAAARVKAVGRRTVPVSRLLILLVVLATAGALTAGTGWWLLRASDADGGDPVEVSARGDAQQPAVAVSGPVHGTHQPGDGADETGRAEFAQALTRIARARAQAFDMVSAGRLELADEPGSPAQRADLALLNRLRSNGYRLEGLTYRISGVRVLKVDGDTAQVSASVGVSAHRLVRAGGGYAAGVPAASPAVMVFTLRAVGGPDEGARRWRVHDIRSRT